MSNLIRIDKQNISTNLKKHYDMFICSSSFDDRCLSIANSLSEIQFSKIRICHFENNYECANQNYELLNEKFNGNLDTNTATLILKKHDPIANYDNFICEFSKINPTQHVDILVDITTFTRENLLILIKSLLQYFTSKNLSVTLCYCPSSEYPKWLSKGVNQIRSVLGYSGDFSPSKKLLLIVLTGFENERSQTLIDNYEPTKLLLGKASSENSINTDLADINKLSFNGLISRNANANEFEFSCIDIEKTKQIVLSIAKEHEDNYNIIVAPMNNKLSTLGVAFAALENHNIQICYASTNQYNIDEKSNESDFFYCFELFDFINKTND